MQSTTILKKKVTREGVHCCVGMDRSRAITCHIAGLWPVIDSPVLFHSIRQVYQRIMIEEYPLFFFGLFTKRQNELKCYTAPSRRQQYRRYDIR